VLVAEAAILLRLHAVGVVLFLLHGVVIPLFALSARQRNFASQRIHLTEDSIFLRIKASNK
jgi:hypothetical protein